MSNFLRVAMAAENNPELARRVEIACQVRGAEFTHDLYIRLLHRVANKLTDVSEVVSVSADGVTDANIDTALNGLLPEDESEEEPGPEGEVE